MGKVRHSRRKSSATQSMCIIEAFNAGKLQNCIIASNLLCVLICIIAVVSFIIPWKRHWQIKIWDEYLEWTRRALFYTCTHVRARAHTNSVIVF